VLALVSVQERVGVYVVFSIDLRHSCIREEAVLPAAIRLVGALGHGECGVRLLHARVNNGLQGICRAGSVLGRKTGYEKA